MKFCKHTFTFLIKYSRPTPTDCIAPKITTDCENFILDFKQLGFYVSLFVLQPLWPWFLNKMQSLLSSEKKTLLCRVTVQFFFFLVLVIHLWHCLWYRGGLSRNLTLVVNFMDIFCIVALDSMNPASVDSLWCLPMSLN